jgi:hypothetical protein
MVHLLKRGFMRFLFILLISLWALSGCVQRQAKSPFEMQINQINSAIPHCSGTIYNNCWSTFKNPKVELALGDNKNDVLAYFKNAGYKVSLNNDKIVFNFEEEYKKQLLHQKVPISTETMILLAFFTTISVLGAYQYISEYKRAKAIKEIYFKQAPMWFIDKENKYYLESHLSLNSVPDSYKFNIVNNEIVSIVKYTKSSVSLIASKKYPFDDIINKYVDSKINKV